MLPKRLRPGQSLTATDQAALVRMVAGMDRGSGTGDVTVSRNNGAFIVRDNTPERIYAKITGAPTGAAYPFSEVARNEDGSYSVVEPTFGGRFGTATSTPAVELAGRTDVPTDSIVELSPLPGGGGWGFTAGSSGIITANVDTTEESTTARLEFDQSTGIRVDAGATETDPDTVSIDLETLVDALPGGLFDVSVQIPTCLSLILNKTYSATPGEEHLLTNVTITHAWKTRTVTMLRGTVVGDPGYCVTPSDCCPSGPDVLINTACCEVDTPRNLTLTISGTGGGSFPIVESGGNWDTGTISLTGAGAGTMTLRLYCFGSDATGWTFQNNSGSPTYTIGTPTYVTRTCDPFEVTCTATLSGGGSYNGETRTFTITY